MKSPLNRGGLRFYLVILALVFGVVLFDTTTPLSIIAGLPCLVLGAWLHTWAKGCLRQNRVVAMIGPYRFVRHPFYLANALVDLSVVVMAGSWPLALPVPFWWLAIYIPVIGGEESYLTANFPEYHDYRLRVPCLIPWRRPLPYKGDGFRWSNPNIAGGEEIPRLLRILAYPLLFLTAMRLKQSGLAGLSDGWGLTTVAGLVMLYSLAWEVERHQRQRREILPAAMRHPLFRLLTSAAVLAAVCLTAAPKTSLGNFVSAGGAALIMLSVPVYCRRPFRALLAELLALLGVLAAGELLWLGPPLTVIYSAWMLDLQLDYQTPAENLGEGSPRMPFWPYFYPILVIAGAAVAGIKLVGHGLPYHLANF
jgi:hypothetical protein